MTPAERSSLARTVLEGLSTGDAFGEISAYNSAKVRERVALGVVGGPWWWTDDTAMALGIEECLHCRGEIDEDLLAGIFARNFQREPERGYGKMAAYILRRILAGEGWQAASPQAFDGGSMGNGAAMRVGPLGAWFADDLDRVVIEAEKSARVTHWHREGIAGAVAVGVAVACAWQTRGLSAGEAREIIAAEVLARTPAGETHAGLRVAVALDFSTPTGAAGLKLGNGSLVTAPDTVPFVIWSALRALDDYQEAVIGAIEAGGDCDTNAAMVGSILAARLGLGCVPQEWRDSREGLPEVGI